MGKPVSANVGIMLNDIVFSGCARKVERGSIYKYLCSQNCQTLRRFWQMFCAAGMGSLSNYKTILITDVKPCTLHPMYIQRLPLLTVLLLGLAVSGCSTYQPTQTNDVCRIFWGETDWYKDARKASKRWGTPIAVMMAIINQESTFRAKVRPDRPTFLFIPLPRRSSAYGYAQAQDPAWSDYRKDTGNWSHDRDDFGDAINFVGWYTNITQRRLGISKWDAYKQYLAYHEGWGGYSRGSFNKKPTLLKVAAKVKRKAATYGAQLKKCSGALDKSVKGWF